MKIIMKNKKSIKIKKWNQEKKEKKEKKEKGKHHLL